MASNDSAVILMAADSISAYQRPWAAATPQSCRAAAQIAGKAYAWPSNEITRRALILPRSVVSAFVIPSAKYFWSESRERFCKGSTASEPMRLGAGLQPSLQNKKLSNSATVSANPIRTARRVSGWPGLDG